MVASKVHFTKTLEELEEFVERKHIPKELGGDEAWIYHYVEPESNENKLLAEDSIRQQLSGERAEVVREYESTTQQWVRERPQTEATWTKRTNLVERLRAGYWEIDPYIRAKSLYDRTGLIREDGNIQFYSDASASKDTSSLTSSGPLAAGHRTDDLD